MKPLRLLIVDDQALVRAGFRKLLESEDGLEVVGEAGDGVEAVTAARRLAPDVVLMDIRMPNLDGIEATRQLATGGRPAPTSTAGAAHGLLGLRERVALYGGALRAGPVPDGGYRVTAVIPLEASA